MLHVLHCIYDDPANPWIGGGGAVRVRELYSRLGREVQATVVTGSYPGAREETIDGIRYRRLGARRPYAWSRWTYAQAATRVLKNAAYDVAVFDFSTYTPIRIPRHKPVGITVHHITGATARERWGGWLGSGIAQLESALLRRARCLSATSGVTQAQLEALLAPGTCIVRVGAGVPDDLFCIGRRERDYLLYFGRLDWFQKGLDTLLDAAALILREHPELELRIAGRGKDAERVRERIRSLGLEGKVRLLGAVTDAERVELFAGALILLMPSRFEGFGMVAAEAMAAGVPVVAAAAGSLPEVIAPPSGGRLVPAGDASALRDAVIRMLHTPAERAEISRSARASAERFRWDEVAHQHLQFLHCIARHAATSGKSGATTRGIR
ncbi:MAG TPA: glycosyltransferase family 4 protein [Chloroflexota bacterium]|nr:glycosyltransferase family 4 protein [Chloroflexota bacterium]